MQKSFALLSFFTFAVVVAGACSGASASRGKARPGNDEEVTPAPERDGDADGDRSGTPGDERADAQADTGTITSVEKVSVTTETLDVAGTAREYVLAVPRMVGAQKSYPLVLVFHGDGGSGPEMRSAYTFDAISGDEAIVAYLSGIDQGWDMQTPSATNRDIAFVEKLVTALSTRYSVDVTRVFGSGLSSGAFFVNKIACRKTGFFRGIVSHAGGAPFEDVDPFASRWPNGDTKCAGQTGGVAALIIHGGSDEVVPPESGDFNATYWASVNGCQETRSDTTPSPCKKHEGCPTSSPVFWCLVPGLGHAVWEHGAEEGWSFMKSL